MLAKDGLEMSLDAAHGEDDVVGHYGALGGVFAWLHDVVTLFVGGVTWWLLCCAWISVRRVTNEELLVAVNSSLSACGMLAFTLIVFSKIPSHASSSMNCTSLLMITFLVNGF